MDQERFEQIAMHLKEANDSMQLMLHLKNTKHLYDEQTFTSMYHIQVEKLATALSWVVVHTGMDEILKESLTQ
jgi:hypothetical protein